MRDPRAFAVGFSGGSGIVYGLRLVQALLDAGHQVHLSATGAALRVLRYEQGVEISEDPDELAGLFERREQLSVYDRQAVESTPASGSAAIAATILIPCSMGTLARVAHGFSSNLIERSADVALKEDRQLILVPRETPLAEHHLENMLKLRRMGAMILPAMPGFYHRPESIADLVDFVVGKILAQLGVDSPIRQRWSTPSDAPESGAETSRWDEGET